MADDADKASVETEILEAADIAAIRNKAQQMPEGKAGECDLCGHWSGRLVLGACAPCRDLFKLP